MARVMRGDAAAHDRVPVSMFANLGMLLDKAAHEIAPALRVVRLFAERRLSAASEAASSQRRRVGRNTIAGSRL